jgi:protein-S-isoprenylcysteine O-methyltransferase Ste14
MAEKSNEGSVLIRKAIALFTITPVLMLGIFYLTAGRLDWWEVWAYMANFLVVAVIGRVLLLIKRPDQARERMEAGSKENVKSWDKWIVPLIALYLPFLSMAAAGLDKRYGWSPILPVGIRIAGLTALFIGGALGNWAMLTNPFFSSHVRIQTDRGHTVVDKGPYSVIRHPGYFGGLISWVAAPFFFSSRVVAVICAITIVFYFYRTSLEDKTLREELPGYKEYAQRVRYRLIPGIW